MAIFFPSESPIKWFNWNDRLTRAARYEKQDVHLADSGMFQFFDTVRSEHRVVLLDSELTVIGELLGNEINLDVISAKNVFTLDILWSDYYILGDVAHLAVIDANDNFNLANFLPSGDFETNTAWTFGAGLTWVSGGVLVDITDTSASLTHLNSLSVGTEYTITINYSSAAVTGVGIATIALAGQGVSALVTAGTGSATFTFTAASANLEVTLSIGTETLTMQLDDVSVVMTASQARLSWISSAFCVGDISDRDLVHACSNNNYFNTFYATTNYVPRVRVISEFRDIPPEQNAETLLTTNGVIENYYVENVFQEEYRVDWLPAYLVNFLSVVFYMDYGAINNTPYRILEEPTSTRDDSAADIIQLSMKIAKEENAGGFKQIVNDPDSIDCPIQTGGYTQQISGNNYVSQNDGSNYIPQN